MARSWLTTQSAGASDDDNRAPSVALLVLVALRFGALRSERRRYGAAARAVAARFPSLAADLGHVPAIFAYRFATAPTSYARLIWREFMGRPLFVRRLTALPRDLTLLVDVHRGKTPPTLITHLAL